MLVAALERPDWSQSRLGREVGIAQSSVGLWVHGKARPEPHLREILELLLGIPESSWMTDEERAQVASTRARLTPPHTASDFETTETGTHGS